MQSPFAPFRSIQAGLFVVLVCSGNLFAADTTKPYSYEEAKAKDIASWRELLEKGDYDSLEKAADELRSSNAKYPNGRGRLWRFCWLTTPDLRKGNEKEYQQAIESLDKWLAAKPKSINVRLVLARAWFDYAAFSRGGRFAELTQEAQLKLFADRSANASQYLDEIKDLTKDVDNSYRRLRIDVSKGLGVKPDVDLVYAGLKIDPLDMDLIHGMTSCLLPRWFGDEGELERFADEVVRRTKSHCGEMHYTTVAIATKEFLKAYTLETHKFDWARLRNGFREFEKKFPDCQEHLDDEAQLAYMAGDLATVYSCLAKIGDHPHSESWVQTQIRFDEFRHRMKPEMMQGDQKRLLLGTVRPVLALDLVGDGEIAVSANWDYIVRMHDVATGERRGWVFLEGINGNLVRVHPKTGLLAAGVDNDQGLILFSLANGSRGGLVPSNNKVASIAFSDKGDVLAVSDEKGLVVVYDLATYKATHTFPATSRRELKAMAFSSKGTQIAGVSGTGDLFVFDLTTEKLETTRKLTKQPLTSIAWCDSYLAVGSNKGEVSVLESPASEAVTTWKTDPLIVTALEFSPDGQKLAIGLRHPIGPKSNQNWDTQINEPLWVWKHRKDKAPQSLKGHKLGVNRVQFADQGKTLVSASHDWTIRVWDVE